MLISFVIPTRDRVSELAFTLSRLEALDPGDLGSAELIIVENEAAGSQQLPRRLANGIAIRHVPLESNLGTAARNVGVRHARGRWIIMLDDDSNLCPGAVGAYLSEADEDLAAVGGEILLPDGSHEAGGLPEVIVGCGCAIRREAFLEVGGYDESFGYYAEEYDLCARLIAGGYRVTHTRAMRFEHRKVAAGRNMDNILYRLVRNNGWVIQRYVPACMRARAMDEMLRRYCDVAAAENARTGYERGRAELEQTVKDQPVRTLSAQHWDRFTGEAVLRKTLPDCLASRQRVSIVGPPRGKGLGQICEAIEACGCTLVEHAADAEALVIGTLSPGPMLDAMGRFPNAVACWEVEARDPAAAVETR